MRTLTSPLAYQVLGVLCVLGFLIAVFSPMIGPGLPVPTSDGEWYFRLAADGPKGVRAPFSGRIIHPLLARVASTIFNIRLEAAFFLVSAVSLVLWVCCIVLLLNPSSFTQLFGYSLMFVYPFIVLIATQFYYPEIVHAALLSAFLVCLQRLHQRFGQYIGLVLLTLLVMTREITVLLSLILLAKSVISRRYKYALGVAVSTSVGLVIVYIVTRQGLPNPENLPGILYLILKLPFNFLRNVLGVEFVTDAIWYCEPVVSWTVPETLQLGNIRTIGLCSWNPNRALSTLGTLLTIFGLQPVILLWAAKTRRLPKAHWVTIAFVYGALLYLLGTSVGSDVFRLVSYGWPLMIVAIASYQVPDKRGDLTLFLLPVFSLAVAWLPKLTHLIALSFIHENNVDLLSSVIVVFVTLIAYLYTYKLLTGYVSDRSP
jgi:hypothetical protein